MAIHKVKGRVAFANNATLNKFDRYSVTIEVSEDDAKVIGKDIADLAKENPKAKVSESMLKQYTPEDGDAKWQVTTSADKPIETFIADETGALVPFKEDIPFGSSVNFALNIYAFTHQKYGQFVSGKVVKIVITQLSDNTGIDAEDLLDL